MDREELIAREGIRHTITTYTMAGDRLRIEEFIAVFTDDAVLETIGVPEQDMFRLQGRRQIHQWISRWHNNTGEHENSVHRASFVRHHLSTCQIEFTGELTAKARTYWTAYTNIGADHCGYYADEFRKIADRWLIAHRRIFLDWRSPDSLMFGAISRTTESE